MHDENPAPGNDTGLPKTSVEALAEISRRLSALELVLSDLSDSLDGVKVLQDVLDDVPVGIYREDCGEHVKKQFFTVRSGLRGSLVGVDRLMKDALDLIDLPPGLTLHMIRAELGGAA